MTTSARAPQLQRGRVRRLLPRRPRARPVPLADRRWSTQVLADERWPDLVDVPTGLGKTSMLDVAVFVAAATAGDPAERRLGPAAVLLRRRPADRRRRGLRPRRHLAAAVATADGPATDVLGRVAAGSAVLRPGRAAASCCR